MNTQHFDILIIGAGLSAIGRACQLQATLPDKTIAVLERRQRLGGTWDLFRYPDIRSDSDICTFGFKFRPWQGAQVLADGTSIRQYIAETATEFGIDDKFHYGLKVLNADWSSAESRWTVTTLHEASGETRTYSCNYLIGCTGYYNYDAGYLRGFPGVDRFKGQCIHPQQWPEDLDYAGKKVVVIGSGATAVTLIPAMASDAGHVTMLQRSPSYIFSLPAPEHHPGLLRRQALLRGRRRTERGPGHRQDRGSRTEEFRRARAEPRNSSDIRLTRRRHALRRWRGARPNTGA